MPQALDPVWLGLGWKFGDEKKLSLHESAGASARPVLGLASRRIRQVCMCGRERKPSLHKTAGFAHS